MRVILTFMKDAGKYSVIILIIVAICMTTDSGASEENSQPYPIMRMVQFQYCRLAPDIVTGEIGFLNQFSFLFHKEFFTPLMAVKSDESSDQDDAIFARYRELSDNPDLGYVRFSEINSREYEFGYGMDQISIGEQILYNLGMVLLQMSAVELDRKN